MENLKKIFSKKISTLKLLVLDFDGVLTDNKVIVSEDGKESVSCWRGDGIGIQEIYKLGIKTIVISSEVNHVLSISCKKLGVDCYQCHDRKILELERQLFLNECHSDQVIYVGNDINDLECMKFVGLSVSVADGHDSIKKIADYVTEKKGGMGAVREVCDLILSCI